MSTAQEDAILAAWDGGESIERIARRLQLSTRRVRTVISYLYDSGEARSAALSATAGSEALARACAASGGRFA